MDKISKGIKIFGWFLIVQGIISYLIPALYGVSQLIKQPLMGKSDFAMFGYFLGPIIFIIFFGYIGWRFLALKKKALRESIFLSVFCIIIGGLQLIYGVKAERFIGLLPLLFYSALLYFVTRPEVKGRFQ